ncbi:class I SAM-dependent methyltransferase [Synechococcus sp. CCY 0621]|uniref:50S ribosomal protein L11 methyltransferase n=1 Tax=Synechococcus sp. CCY 0621 TaxID=2815603 RepID=UPI001C23040C|nr:class I SAM-dependent methyltransferase [Synechococcus sp. CCY 0621]
MGKSTGYNILSYGDMVNNRQRMDPYARTLQQAVRRDSVVLDIGAGTGIFSLLACRFGAAEVHAVEPDASIDLARTMAAANGFADRIHFHQTLSTAITLPRPADVIVSDLRGVLPLFQHHIAAIADARSRLLAPGGVLIPARDQLWAALIDVPEVYRPYTEPWLSNTYALDLSPGQPLVVNTWRKLNAKADQLLVEPAHWATLDYQTIQRTDVSGELSWILERPGTAHGVLVWFDAELADGIGFSNRPGELELIYGQAFFPFQAPVRLEQGDHVAVALSATLVNDNYLWRWDTRARSGDHLKANFRQSTFYGTPVALEALKRRSADFVPSADTSAAIDRCVLSHIDGKTTLGTIAETLMEMFPERFHQHQDALNYSANLAEKYRPATNG